MSRFQQRMCAALRNPEAAVGYAEMRIELAKREMEHMREEQAMSGEQGTVAGAMEPRTFLAAALEVLRAAREPLTSDEITDEALRRGLLVTEGKTPQRTILPDAILPGMRYA